MNSNKKIQNMIIYIYIIINYLSFFSCSIFKIYSNICPIFTFIAFVFIFIFNINSIFKENQKDIIFLIIVGAVQLIVATMTKTSIGSMLSNITIILGVIVFSKFTCNKKTYMVLLILTILLDIRMLLISPNSYNKYLYNPNENFNPNTIGQVLMYCIIIFNFCTSEMKINKIYGLAFSIISLVGIYLTESRTSLVTSIAFLLFFYPFKFIWKNNKFKNITIISTIIIILVIPFITTYLYNKNVDFTTSYLQKPIFTGREKIWKESIQLLNDEQWGWFFGLGSNVKLASYEYINMHNMIFSIIFNFGIVVTIAMIWFFISKLLVKQNNISKEREMLLLCCLGFLLAGIFETSIYWPNMYFFSLFLLGQNEKYRKLDKGIDIHAEI